MFGGEECALDVDVHHLVPLAGGGLDGGAVALDSGRGDQNVEPAVDVDHRLYDCGHRDFVSDIEFEGLIRGVRDGAQAVDRAEPGRDDLCSAAGQQIGRGQADSTEAACHQRDLAGELVCHRSSLREALWRWWGLSASDKALFGPG
jgi:hypothetical protein